ASTRTELVVSTHLDLWKSLGRLSTFDQETLAQPRPLMDSASSHYHQQQQHQQQQYDQNGYYVPHPNQNEGQGVEEIPTRAGEQLQGSTPSTSTNDLNALPLPEEQKKGTKRNGTSKNGPVEGGSSGTTTKEGGGGEVKYDKDGNPKKKRKQLVACDSCRLRRVKCDRAEKNGDPCSECGKKKITCTDTYVRSKPKTQTRTGKLIKQAKALYGNDPSKWNLQSTGVGETTPTSESSSNPFSTSVQPVTTPRTPSRQEVVSLSSTTSQSRLVQSQISRDISSELISTFFSVLHQICPLVDRDQFEVAWNLAGQVSENLTPANECLAAVLQAWASRISDNPLIVGYGVPTLEEVKNGGMRDYTLVGNRREEFAQAMKERALRLVDERGLLRISSAAACSALTLLEFLVTFDDTSRTNTRGRYLMVAAAEHLRNLNDGQCDDITEPLLTPEQTSGGTLLWMVYTRDALVALMGGRFSCFTEDELTSLCDLFTNPITADVLPYISSKDTRLLAGLAVASMFRHVVASVRRTITLLASPLARRSRLNEDSLNLIWSEIDNTSRFTQIFRQSVDSVDFGSDAPDRTHVWFRDLMGIKGQHLLGIHTLICQTLDREEARVAKMSGGSTQEDGGDTYLGMLRRVKDQSDERILSVAREFTAMIRTYGSTIMHSALFTVEYTRDYLHHMVESPSWEQGGPTNYSFANKLDECAALMETMQIAGWIWANFDRDIHQARNSLARQGHRLREHQERQRHNSYPQPTYHSTEQQHYSSNSVESWPPRSMSHASTPTSVSLPQHSYPAPTASIPAPSLPHYYEPNPTGSPLNYAATTTTNPSYPSSSSATDTSLSTPTSLPPPQPNGLASYTSGEYPSSSNPAYYQYSSATQNGDGFVAAISNGDGGGGGYAVGGNQEIRRLPSMNYGH
ncbi:uncharacterized protein JCM6883_007292, partial [Sporobolomyces salmoneus]|uniref:uncharacterized protein n=1 Tax=Sporobolomyces salmoneus TaxID=183962 RepID=UPI00317F9B8C